MKSYLFLTLGLILGATGAFLFVKSLPPPAGSEAARVVSLEREIKQAKSKVAELEAIPGLQEDLAKIKSRNRFSDKLAGILRDLKAGRPVDVEDVYNAMKGHMRDLAPLFGVLRRHAEKKEADRLSGTYARTYNLNPEQQQELASWLKSEADARMAEYNTKMWAEETRLVDAMKMMKDRRPEDGIDPMMEKFLSGEALAQFKDERMTQRAQSVQEEADRRLNRLHSIVTLDEAQQDQVFSLMARNSQHYDPAMKLSGLGSDTASVGAAADRESALQSILRPDQRATYEAESQRRRAAATQEMAELGLKLPDDWNLWDGE
jgi:hypothetical protein